MNDANITYLIMCIIQTIWRNLVNIVQEQQQKNLFMRSLGLKLMMIYDIRLD